MYKLLRYHSPPHIVPNACFMKSPLLPIVPRIREKKKYGINKRFIFLQISVLKTNFDFRNIPEIIRKTGI